QESRPPLQRRSGRIRTPRQNPREKGSQLQDEEAVTGGFWFLVSGSLLCGNRPRILSSAHSARSRISASSSLKQYFNASTHASERVLPAAVIAPSRRPFKPVRRSVLPTK